MRHSLRLRLILGTTLCMAALYAVMSVILYLAIQRSLWNELDAALLVKARALVAVVEESDKGITLDVEPTKLEPVRAEDGFVMWTADGKVFASSANMGRAANPLTGEAGEFTGYSQLANGHRARYVAIRFVARWEEDAPKPAPEQRGAMTLMVLRDTSSVDRRLWQLVTLLVVLCGVTIVAAAATMQWIIRRGLRPLDQLAAEIQGIGDDELGRKVVLADAAAEIQPIVDRLNELLARLEASFERERSFTADVAHELRTPLAGLTAALEVSIAQRRAPADYERVIQRCLQTSRSMRTMVENLLTLARADARQLEVHKKPIAVEHVIRELWQAFEPEAAARQLGVLFLCDAPDQVATDPGLLQLVLRNLIDNAVTYTPTGGTITIRTAADASDYTLTLENPAGPLRPENVSNIFDRFWRGDTARSNSGQHCGLGLPLCQRVLQLLDATITASVRNGIFSITLRIPDGRLHKPSSTPKSEPAMH